MNKEKMTFAVFKIGKEKYALHVDYAKRIVVPQYIRELPNTSPEIKGITNVDESIVTVVDLRVKFGLNSENLDETPYIIISTHEGLKDIVLGYVVDEVNEVLTIVPDKDGNIPINTNITGNFTAKDTQYIYGVYKKEILSDVESKDKDYELIIVLDAEKLLTEDIVKELSGIDHDN